MRHLALLSVCALAASAHAGVLGVTGNATQIGNPASCLPGALTGPTTYVWNELQPSALISVPVDLTVNPGSSALPTPGVINGVFNTHLLHFEDFSGVSSAGTVTFDGVIVGVAYRELFLDVSDAPAGALGTVYPTGGSNRGMNGLGSVAISGAVLSFNFSPIAGQIEAEQVRVYTVPVPAPGPLALAGLGALLAARRRRGA